MADADASTTEASSRRISSRVKVAPKPYVPPPAPVKSAAKAKATSTAKSTPGDVPNSHTLRTRRSNVATYAESSDDDDNGRSDSENDYDDEPESPEEPEAERGAEIGKSLRPRKSLTTPANRADYVDTDLALSNRRRSSKSKKALKKKKAVGKRVVNGVRACKACRDARVKCDRKQPRCGRCTKTKKTCTIQPAVEGDIQQEESDSEEMTLRGEIRLGLEETKRKRDAFYIKYRSLFEPLLPERNYISKMVEKNERAEEPVKEQAVEEDTDASKTEPTATEPITTEPTTSEHTISEPASSEPTTVPTTAESATAEAATAPVTVEVRENARPAEAKAEPVAPVPYVPREIIPYKLLEKQPEHVKATMKPYQLSGLSFLVWLYRNGMGGVLGDEMGLGKTLQTLSLFSYLTTYEPVPEGHQRPFLVVCPLSVLSSWVAECKKWTPHLRVLRFHGPTTERARLKKVAESGELFGSDDHAGEGRGYDVVVTSYEVFDREKSWFRRAFVWRYVVLDEGHKIKNDKTNISVSLQSLAAEYRLILTGTPLQNNLTELWALLHWLYPDVFGENTSKLFSDAFDLTLGKNDLGVMDKARGLLELVMLRRMKESAGVNLDLPKKTEVEMYLPLSPMQRFWYRRLLTRMDKGLLEGLFSQSKDKSTDDVKEESKEAVQGEITKQEDLEDFKGGEWAETRRIVQQVEAESSSSDGKWRKLMNLLMQLRKCCNHPYLLPNAEPEDVDDRISALMLASTKMIFLDKLIEELCIKQGKKVLVFSGFTKMIDICEDFLHMKGGDGTRFKYGRLDGTTPRARRNLAIRLFNTDPAYKVMMISTRAGGLGINLASASDVVMLDTDWNPQADLQAQARAHRIGQVNPVTIYRLITQGTVEEQMMGRIRKKLYLSAKVTESMRNIHSEIAASGPSGEAEDDLPTLTSGQLMALVRSGSRAIARPEIDPTEMLQWDWETTIQKCRDYQKELENDVKGEEGNAEEEKKWLSEMERVESRVFEGKTHEKNLTSNREIAQEWSREARRVGMERVLMIGGHAVLKETIGNNEWEAVKTFAGKDSRLAEPAKRKRKAIEHQEHCQVCYDGGELHTCTGCPRTYHRGCLPESFVPRLDGKLASFYCPQHECVECEQKTANAGGLIFRCRWCENGYCEDCLNWDRIEIVGDNLPEFQLLGFGTIDQAFFIKCEQCVYRHEVDHDARKLCQDMEKDWTEEKERRDAAELTTGGTTVEGSEVATPFDEPDVMIVENPAGKKRKRQSTAAKITGPRKMKKEQHHDIIDVDLSIEA